MADSQTKGSMHFSGELTGNPVTLTANSITKDKIVSGAGIESTKCQQRYSKTFNWNQDHLENPTAEDGKLFIVHLVTGATGILRKFEVAAFDTGSSGGLDVILHRQRASVQTVLATVSLGSSDTDHTFKTVALSTLDLVQGDYLLVEADDTGTATGMNGLMACVVLDEDPV